METREPRNPGGAANAPAASARLRVRAMKAAAYTAAALTLLLLAVMLILPSMVDLRLFRQTYLPLVEQSLRRRVRVGEVRLSLLPTPAIRLSDVEITDGPAAAANTVFVAEQLRLRLKLWPLLRGRFEVTELILQKPVVHLFAQAESALNYPDPAGKNLPPAKKGGTQDKPSSSKPPEDPRVPLVFPSRMRIHDGALSIATKTERPVKIDGIDLWLNELAADAPFSYRASFNYPGLKSVSVEGQLSYHEPGETLTLKNNRLRVQEIDLPLEGTVSRLSTLPRVHLSAASDAVDAKAIAHVLAVFELLPQDVELSGPVSLHVTVAGLFGNLAAELWSHLKDVKVDAKRSIKGRVSGELFMKAPLGKGAAVRRLEGSGKLKARDGELTHPSLVHRIRRAGGSIGLSKTQAKQATTFKTLEADFTVSKGVADFTRIYWVNPQLEVNGAGTMALEQRTIDLSLETALSREVAARAPKAKAISLFKDRNGRIVVPLKLTGRVESPAVNLDTDRVVQKGMTAPQEKNFSALVKQLLRR